jgi:dTDP-4-amino-4,6-dideoxygalactose transaminase
MYGIEEGYLPITEEVMTRHFHLPMQVTLTVADAKFIASSVLKVIEKLKRK